MSDNITEIQGLPVNTEGEIVARLGTGGRGVAGILPKGYNPINASGEMVVNLVPAATDESFVTAKTNPVTGRITKATASGRDMFADMGYLRLLLGKTRQAMTVVGNSLAIGTNTLNAMSFATQLQARYPEGVKLLANSAVGGRSSAVILANLDVDVPAGTKILMYHEGTNDAAAASQVSLADHISHIKDVCEWAISRGILPIIVGSPTVDVGGTAVKSSIALIEKYSLAERILADSLCIPYVDPWGAWIDTSDGSWNSAAGVTDALHPPQKVHDAVAVEVASQLRAGKPPGLQPRCNLGSAGVHPAFANVLNLTGSGVPTGWSQNGTAPSTSAPSAAVLPIRGNWSDHTVSALTTTGDLYRYLHSGGGFATGETVRVSGYFKFTNTSNMRLAVRLSLIRSVSPNTSLYLFDTDATFGETYFEADVVVPSDLTQATLWVSYKPVTAGAYSGAFSFAALDVYNISRHTF